MLTFGVVFGPPKTLSLPPTLHLLRTLPRIPEARRGTNAFSLSENGTNRISSRLGAQSCLRVDGSPNPSALALHCNSASQQLLNVGWQHLHKRRCVLCCTGCSTLPTSNLHAVQELSQLGAMSDCAGVGSAMATRHTGHPVHEVQGTIYVPKQNDCHRNIQRKRPCSCDGTVEAGYYTRNPFRSNCEAERAKSMAQAAKYAIRASTAGRAQNEPAYTCRFCWPSTRAGQSSAYVCANRCVPRQ